MKQFEIDLIDHYFLSKEDICSHGFIFLRVNNEIISNKEDAEWNINESALAMLRSLKFNIPSDTQPRYFIEGVNEDTMIYHCGCFMLFCPCRISWKVQHNDKSIDLYDFIKCPSTDENDQIEYKNLRTTILRSDYVREVYNFAIKTKQLFMGREEYKSMELFEGQFSEFWGEYEELLKHARLLIECE